MMAIFSEFLGESPGARRGVFRIAAVLAGLVFLLFLRTGWHSFVLLDDDRYIENPWVRAGLTTEGIQWAFRTFHASNWHPLTWLSHMLDVEMFGLEPGPHHLVNAGLHAANTALLFLALRGMTGNVWRSAFVAALFGAHPLHVESVAWVAERKDVLSGLFFMLLLLSYARYARRRGAASYILVLALLCMGLMSKPMLVTVPFLLQLLDVWPLGRTTLAAPAEGGPWEPMPWGRLLLEKAPMMAVSAASCALTFVAQQAGGAVAEMDFLPLGSRISNALVAWVSYAAKTLWPSSLAIFYPLQPEGIPFWKAAASAAALIAGMVAVIRLFRRYPYLSVGLFWYLGMLVPVIGLVQVGGQAMADRYTYLPLTGLFVAAAWLMGDVSAGWRFRRAVWSGTAILIVLACSASTFVQAGRWKDSEALFRHTLSATRDNWLIQMNLGIVLQRKGLLDEAIGHYRETLRLRPALPHGHLNIAGALSAKGFVNEAIAHYREAIRLKPDFPEAYYNLGVELQSRGRFDEAIGHYRDAIRFRADFADAHYNLGLALYQRGFLDEAIRHYREAIRIRPDRNITYTNLGIVLAAKGRRDEAIAEFRKALSIDPGDGVARENLFQALEAGKSGSR